MNLETMLNEWAARCRQLARSARDDAERSAAFNAANPDATLPLARRDAGEPREKR